MDPSDNTNKDDMNARQQWVTGLMAVLMLGTILMMPADMPAANGGVTRQAGRIVHQPEIRAELPADQVRDLTYN